MKLFLKALLFSFITASLLFGIAAMIVAIADPLVFHIPGKIEQLLRVYIGSTLMGAIGYYIGSAGRKN